ncbi:MAG: SUMF1/EgtB/PvdO family nonheme iron enzyme, partial [Planctomycetaceae bacterium]
MLENPLLTTILCLVYDDNEALPENRADLYKKAIELMLKRKRPDGDEVQDEGVKKGRSKKAGHDAPTLRVPYHIDAATAALAEVAWWLQQKSQRVLGSIPALAKVAGEKLIARTEPDIERDGAKFLECMRSEVGLLAGGGGGKEAELGFIHRTFQEYLASVAAISNGEAKTLADSSGSDWWREVVALSLRSSTDFNRVFFERFLENRIINQNPSLSTYSLGEASEFPNLAIDSYLRGQRKKGAEGAKAAVEVLQWLEGSSFKTPSLIPVLADLAHDANAPVRDLAKKLQHRGAPQQAAGTKPRRTRNTKGANLLAAPSWGASARRATGERLEDPATKLSFIWIAPGSFQMGSDAGDKDESPKHPVTISHGYWLGEFPVTNEQYAVFLRETQAREPELWDDNRFNQPQQPVVGTSWLDAMRYCAWATRKLGVR